MDRAGFGGAEIAFDAGSWASAAQRNNLTEAIAFGEERGFQLDMTMGASWPVRTPNTRAGTGLSSQELQYGRIDLDGGTTFNGTVPTPFDDPTNTRGARLVAVVAARVLDAGPAVVRPDEAPARSTILAPTSLTDLTASIGAGNSLVWDVPDGGRWILFGFWSRDSAQGVMDHFSADAATAVTQYLDVNQIGEDNSRRLRAVGGSFFEDSLEIDAAELYWTPKMAQQFEQRRGYAMARYLPLMFVQGMNRYWVPNEEPTPDFELPDGQGERIRRDYYRTITDLYVDEHLPTFADWAQQHGMQFRSQVAFGQDLDAIRSARELVRMGGIADEESLNAGDVLPSDQTNPMWRFALDHHRTVAGGVHQGGGLEINNELGAVFRRAFHVGLQQLKGMQDKEWAAGTTRPMVHGYAYQTAGAAWPGRQQFFRYIADSWNADTYPQWRRFKSLNDYWARGTLVLQSGMARTDVAIYRDGFLTTAARGGGESDWTVTKQLFDAQAIEEQGYTLEYIDPVGVAERQAQGDGVLYPNGPRYHALVIDERRLPADAAEAIADQAERGLAVVLVGALPDADTSYKNPGRGDTRVRQAVARMLRAPKVARVATQADAAGALRQLGVQPAAAWDRPVQVYSQHRDTADGDYFYLYNATDRAVSFTPSFATVGRPYSLDLWDGSIDSVVRYDEQGGRTSVPLTLAPHGNAVLAFRAGERAGTPHVVSADADTIVPHGAGGAVELRDDQPGAREVRFSNGEIRTPTVPAAGDPIVPSSWSVHVDAVSAAGTTPIDLQLDGLRDWRQIPALATVGGTATYTTNVSLPAGWSTADRGMTLELGRVEGAITVLLNGREVAPDGVATRSYDVTDLLKAGENELTVRLASTLANQQAALPGWPNIPGVFVIEPQTQATGLIGPVRLVPFGRAVVDPTPGSPRPPVEPPRPPVEQPRPPAGRRPSRVAVSAAKTVRLAGLTKRGLLVTVRLPQGGGGVTAMLSAKLPRATRTSVLARSSRSTTRATTISLRLKAGPAAARRLRLALAKRRSVKASIRVTARIVGAKPTTRTLRVTILR
ncbi:glycosyl hydrolase [Conexibacter stalactiti]|uniref:Glycosyl hydrolase n=1 Tax=Conexibacter stalactiti TaxID=1940611 RepID=A0ABU4HK25_9ACTN|nr:glycosyl hydrolase [Conexibacter stalactiti]MDW5593054.1 glycosyl hydrolase [Conexibacter stalactiti]MEC5033695.1 glycosyl hydrolase [Conexibacter stalactiti]